MRKRMFLRPRVTWWTALSGPAMLAEGLIQTFTLGKVQFGWPVRVARRILKDDLVWKQRQNDLWWRATPWRQS